MAEEIQCPVVTFKSKTANATTLDSLDLRVGVPPMHAYKNVYEYKIRDAAAITNSLLYELTFSGKLNIGYKELISFIQTELNCDLVYLGSSIGTQESPTTGYGPSEYYGIKNNMREHESFDDIFGSVGALNASFKSSNSFISIEKDDYYIESRALFLDKSSYCKYRDFLAKYNHKSERQSCGILKYNGDCYSIHYIENSKAKLTEINYTEKIISKYKNVMEDLNSKNPKGRITILSGPPGTGKTNFIRGILNDMPDDAITIYVPTQFVANLDSPSFLPFLLNLKASKLVFILEDCDSILIPRGMDTVNTLSSFLNLTDGLLGTYLDIRIIASTNASALKFDKAITRPGRLSELIDFASIPAEQANKIYKNITNKSPEILYTKELTLAEIYFDAKGGNSRVKQEDRKVGF